MERSSLAATLLVRCVVVTCCLGILADAVDPLQDPKEFRVFGYLPEYRLGGFNYSAAFNTGLTHLIFFSLEIDPKTGQPSALDRLPSKKAAAEARAAADKVGGKILLSFGGNARSQGFPTAAKTAKSRGAFLKRLDRLLRDYQFDGVDYNWEYPNDAEEWRQWGKLLRESKEFLLRPAVAPDAPEGLSEDEQKTWLRKANYVNNIVTFTMYLDPGHYSIIERFNLLRHADYVHCMAYDMRGEHSTMAFAKRGIDLLKKSNLSSRKYTLGVPFYGRSVDTMAPETWYDLVDKMKDKPETQDKLGRIYFNNKATLRAKTKLSLDEKIGGIMIWELGQDKQPLSDPSALMTAINDVVAPVLQRAPSSKKEDTLKTADEL